MTEHNIFQEIEDDLAQQKYEELWKRYGVWVVTVATVAVLATAGVSGWRSWHTDRNQESTVALFNILEKANNADQARQMADLEKFALAKHSAPHEILATLDAAAMASSLGNVDRALQLYDQIANDSAIDPVFRQFADLMAVRVQMDKGDPAALEKRLEPLLADDKPWHYSALECDAFLSLRSGNTEKARKIFAELSEDARVPQSLGARAADMLHFLSE